MNKIAETIINLFYMNKQYISFLLNSFLLYFEEEEYVRVLKANEVDSKEANEEIKRRANKKFKYSKIPRNSNLKLILFSEDNLRGIKKIEPNDGRMLRDQIYKTMSPRSLAERHQNLLEGWIIDYDKNIDNLNDYLAIKKEYQLSDNSFAKTIHETMRKFSSINIDQLFDKEMMKDTDRIVSEDNLKQKVALMKEYKKEIIIKGIETFIEIRKTHMADKGTETDKIAAQKNSAEEGLIKELEDKIEYFKKQIYDQNAKYHELYVSFDANQRTMFANKNQVEELKKKLDQKTQDASFYKSELDRIQTQMTKKEEEFAKLHGELGTVSKLKNEIENQKVNLVEVKREYEDMLSAEQGKLKEATKIHNSQVDELQKKIGTHEKTISSLQEKIKNNETLLITKKETEKEIQKINLAKPITHNRASQCTILPSPGGSENTSETKSPTSLPDRTKHERKSEMAPQIEKNLEMLETKTTDKRYSLDQTQNLFIQKFADNDSPKKKKEYGGNSIHEASSEESDSKEAKLDGKSEIGSKNISPTNSKKAKESNLKKKTQSKFVKTDKDPKRKDSSDQSVGSPLVKHQNPNDTSSYANSPKVGGESPKVDRKGSISKSEKSPKKDALQSSSFSSRVTDLAKKADDSPKRKDSPKAKDPPKPKEEPIKIKEPEKIIAPKETSEEKISPLKSKEESKPLNQSTDSLKSIKTINTNHAPKVNNRSSFSRLNASADKRNSRTSYDDLNNNSGNSDNEGSSTMRESTFNIKLESTEMKTIEEEPEKNPRIQKLLKKLKSPRRKKNFEDQPPIHLDEEAEELINALVETKLTPRKGAALKISILKLMKYPTLLYKLGGYLDLGFNQSFDDFVAEYNQVSVKGNSWNKIPETDEEKEYKLYKKMIKSRNQGFKQAKVNHPPSFFIPKKYEYTLPKRIFQPILRRDKSEDRGSADILKTEGAEPEKNISQTNRSFSLPQLEKDEAMIQNFYMVIKRNPTHIAESMKLLRETLEIKDPEKDDTDTFNQQPKTNYIKNSLAVTNYSEFKKLFRELMANHTNCLPFCRHIDDFYEKLLYSQKNTFSQSFYSTSTKLLKEKIKEPKFKLFEMKI